MTADAQQLTFDGRTVRVTSPGRILFPLTGFTKADLIEYYVRVADVLLPHVVDRPATLHRFPEGVDGPRFFQTRVPPHPDWVRTVTLTYPRTGKTFDAPVIDDVASLVWASNLSAIELHPFLARTSALDRPLLLVFDLDPGPPAGVIDAATLALRLRVVLRDAGLAPYVKFSGQKGLHVVAPLDGTATYDDTKAFAHAVALTLATDDPTTVTARMSKRDRPGKVFVDWSQNDAGKSTVAPYSLRGLRVPSVAVPLSWDEVEHAVAKRDPRAFVVAAGDIDRRLTEVGDPFAALDRDAANGHLP